MHQAHLDHPSSHARAGYKHSHSPLRFAPLSQEIRASHGLTHISMIYHPKMQLVCHYHDAHQNQALRQGLSHIVFVHNELQ